MLQDDRHLTIEQLSAFLDQQLPEQEQALSKAHLDTCEDCRRELTGIRQTVALLRALPPVELPRSFVLPVEDIQDDEKQDEGKQAAPVRHPVRLIAFRVAVRTMSTIAAVIGAFFLVSTLLTALPASMEGHSTASTTAGTTQTSNQPRTSAATPDPQIGVNQLHPQTTPYAPDLTSTPTPTSTYAPLQPSKPIQLPAIFIFDLNTQGGRIGAGILLLMFGIMGILLTRRGDKLAPEKKS